MGGQRERRNRIRRYRVCLMGWRVACRSGEAWPEPGECLMALGRAQAGQDFDNPRELLGDRLRPAGDVLDVPGVEHPALGDVGFEQVNGGFQ